MIVPYYLKMLYSSNTVWEEVDQSVVKTLFYMVLPLSLLPPVMILYAGFEYGERFFPAANEVLWISSAAVFLIAELITVMMMAWAIKNIAASRGIQTEYRNTLAVTSFSAVPMWLSSFVLFLPHPLFVIGMVLLGLLASICLNYFGTKNLLKMHEELEVANITHTTISLGVVAWVFLVTLIAIPLLW
ncbi:YIP1 family protein [Colwellia sp. MSW7]|uniref:YIP1 family protein n=1 Tax=Colwellia maritima TaxID=2912588 RepID=A0ABS9X3P0_9GAMM|nr:YIP1 family protein [Colwellia maritima]